MTISKMFYYNVIYFLHITIKVKFKEHRINLQGKKQTSVRYSTWDAEGPKKSESRDGLRLLSPSLAWSKQIALNFSIVVLSVRRIKEKQSKDKTSFVHSQHFTFDILKTTLAWNNKSVEL